MKHKIYLLFLLPFLLGISGCGFDEPLETTQQHDGDDINILQDVGPQALDQVIRGQTQTPTKR